MGVRQEGTPWDERGQRRQRAQDAGGHGHGRLWKDPIDAQVYTGIQIRVSRAYCSSTFLISQRFSSHFFIDGSSEDRIRADVVRNVRALGIEHSQKGFEDCILFLSQPSPTGPRLLLYDNVDDPSMDLSSFLPRGISCAVVITSRNHLLGVRHPRANLPLDVMSIDEAVELLLYDRDRSGVAIGQAKTDATALAQALGCLPIALQQARSYMEQTRCSIKAYLERLSRSRQKLLGRPISFQLDMQAISTYATFETSFIRLDVRVQKLLFLLSHFHWRKFPLGLVSLAAKYDFSKHKWVYLEHGEDYHIGKGLLEVIFLQNGEWDSTELDDMILSLQNYSLVRVGHGVSTSVVEMHPLIHEWTHTSIPTEEKHGYRSAAVLLLALGAHDAHRAITQYLASHVNHMFPIWNHLHVNNVGAFGDILRKNGMYHSAVQLYEMVAEVLKQCLDAKDIQLSNSLGNLALIYHYLGRLDEAKVLQEEVLKLSKEILGEHHPHTIAASNNLANTYYGLGRLNEAKVLQEEVMKLSKEILGEHHPDTIKASNNLALIYHSLGIATDSETK